MFNDIDWKELIKAVIKAILPFFSGALGGLLSAAPSTAPAPVSRSDATDTSKRKEPAADATGSLIVQ